MRCSLGEEGAAALADFVKQGKKLKELNLYMNDIGTGGAYKVSLPVSSRSSDSRLQPYAAVMIFPMGFNSQVMPLGQMCRLTLMSKMALQCITLLMVLFYDMGKGMCSTVWIRSTGVLCNHGRLRSEQECIILVI